MHQRHLRPLAESAALSLRARGPGGAAVGAGIPAGLVRAAGRASGTWCTLRGTHGARCQRRARRTAWPRQPGPATFENCPEKAPGREGGPRLGAESQAAGVQAPCGVLGRSPSPFLRRATGWGDSGRMRAEQGPRSAPARARRRAAGGGQCGRARAGRVACLERGARVGLASEENGLRRPVSPLLSADVVSAKTFSGLPVRQWFWPMACGVREQATAVGKVG